MFRLSAARQHPAVLTKLMDELRFDRNVGEVSMNCTLEKVIILLSVFFLLLLGKQDDDDVPERSSTRVCKPPGGGSSLSLS